MTLRDRSNPISKISPKPGALFLLTFRLGWRRTCLKVIAVNKRRIGCIVPEGAANGVQMVSLPPPGAVSFWNLQSRSPLPYVPRYHFDVIGKNTIADRTGLLLPDDTHASDAADRLASELYEIRPELRVRECAVLVTDDGGEEVHRAPIVKVH